jgi:hypothetical protein
MKLMDWFLRLALIVLFFSGVTEGNRVCGGKFRAKAGREGMLLWIDGKSQGLIPKHHSFWETH